jgi:hypothetical protein
MVRLSGSRLFVLLHLVLLCVSTTLTAESLHALASVPPSQANPVGGLWTAPQAEHIDGFPDIKPHKKGTLTLNADDLTFTGKSGPTAIPRNSITAVSAGNERVEIGGLTGRLVRMAIPNGGGVAVSAVAHHRIDMLTVEFSDNRGGAHSAIFFLGANKATQAIQAFALVPHGPQTIVPTSCQSGLTEPGSLLLSIPDWKNAQVPAVYQGLVYEHLIERFRTAKSLTRVYREGESLPEGLCPQYTLHLTVTSFKEGSSVKRAMLGPVGMFVGTTQMIFNAELKDRTGKMNINEPIKATIRSETESTAVADSIAKALKKKYEKAVKADEKKAHAPSDAPKV